MNPVTGEIEQIEQYTAERILRKRIVNERIEYLVKVKLYLQNLCNKLTQKCRNSTKVDD